MHWNASMILFTCLLCILARAIQIFSLSFVANLGRRRKIPFKMQCVMVFAGLRGAIAFALSLNVVTPNKASLVTTTMTIVILTTLGCGATTYPLLKKLGLVRSAEESDFPPLDVPMLAPGAAPIVFPPTVPAQCVPCPCTSVFSETSP